MKARGARRALWLALLLAAPVPIVALGEGAIPAPQGELVRFSTRTLTDPAALEREVARAAECGFAENSDEWIPGLSVVAAPVFGSTPGARMVAAVAMGMTTPRMRALGTDAIGQRAIAAAARIASRLAGVSQ